MALVDLDNLYVICRENDPRRMHMGYEGVVGPKFYKKGYANAPCAQLNNMRERHLSPFNASVYDRKYFSEESIRGFAQRHATHMVEEIERGEWVVKRASEVFAWRE